MCIRDRGMGKRTNTVLQSAFFALAGVLPQEDALKYMKDAATKSYAKKGEAIVEANHKAIDAGATAFVKFDVPADWADATDVAPASVPVSYTHLDVYKRQRRSRSR